MRTRTHFFLTTAALALALALVQPGAAGAATVDINGHLYDTDADQGVTMNGGTTVVSEQVLGEDFDLTVTRDGDDFTLTNAFGDFTITGRVGETFLTMDGDMVFDLPVAAAEEDGQLVLPLRTLAERFGTVTWYGDQGQTLVRVDHNGLMQIPDAVKSGDAVTATYVMNGGFGDMPGKLAYDEDSGGILWYNLNDDGYATSFGYNKHDLVQVQHKGYGLHWLALDDDYVYWWEYPLESGLLTSYLYIQPRDGSAAPTLIAESDFVASHDGGVRAYGSSFCEAADGNVIWTVADATGDNTEVWLYEQASGEKTLLDSLPATDGHGSGAQVTMGDGLCAWTTERYVKANLKAAPDDWESMATYGDLKLYDLASDETQNLSQGYNLCAPELSGHRLIARTRIDASGFATPDESLLVYDLEKDAWTTRVRQSLLGIDPGDKNIYLYTSDFLDEDHMVLGVFGLGRPQQLQVLDLADGSVRPVIDGRSGEAFLALWDNIYDTSLLDGHTAVTDLRPVSDKGTSLAATRTVHDGSFVEGYHPVTFEW